MSQIFFFFVIKNLRLHRIHKVVHLLNRHLSLPACENNTIQDLVPVVLLTTLIFLDHHHGNRFDFLIGGEALATAVADASPPDGIIFLHRSGIYYSGIILATKWTFHLLFSVYIVL
jgi:hypothetical protein